MKPKERSVLIGGIAAALVLIGIRVTRRGRVVASCNIDNHDGLPGSTAATPDLDHDPDLDPDDFKGSYQTLVAIIQGVAFGALGLASLPALHASIAEGRVAQCVTITTQALVTLIAIIIVTNEYFELTRAGYWYPTVVDTAIPYVLGAGEFLAAGWVGNNSSWWGSLSFFLAASAAAFKHSAFKAKMGRFRDEEAYRIFIRSVNNLFTASVITLAFAAAVCLASIYSDLSTWFYAVAPLIAAASFNVTAYLALSQDPS
jgi:hypothetical protein